MNAKNLEICLVCLNALSELLILDEFGEKFYINLVRRIFCDSEELNVLWGLKELT